MKKSIHYRDCVWLGEMPEPLENVLQQAFTNLSRDQEFGSFVLYDDLHCMVKQHHAGEGFKFFHFVTYEEGSRAAVVSVIDVETNEVMPPDNQSEFIESQLFILVRANHVLYVSHNKALRDGKVGSLLLAFVAETMQAPHDQFGLAPRFNEGQLAAVFDSGIAYIDLNLGTFSQTIETLQSNGRLTGQGPLASLLGFFLNQEDGQAAADRIDNRMTIMPKRNWNQEHVRNLMSGIAMDVTEEFDEGFTIVTKSGVRVKRDQISVREELDAVGGTTRLLPALVVRAGLIEAYRRLDDNRILET